MEKLKIALLISFVFNLLVFVNHLIGMQENTPRWFIIVMITLTTINLVSLAIVCIDDE